MRLTVVFTPEAQQQLIELYHDISSSGSPEAAARYTSAIVAACEDLCTFPIRGTRRDDVRAGVRITHHKKRTTIAFSVDNDTVTILGIFYGGQNYEHTLQDSAYGVYEVGSFTLPRIGASHYTL